MKKKYNLSKKEKNLVLPDITDLHNTRTKMEFDNMWKKIKLKWKKSNLEDFVNKFSEQWIDGRFNNWQVFQTPPGYSSANSLLENFNKTMKGTFTLRKQLSVYRTLELIQEKVLFYSNLDRRFNNSPRVTKDMTKEANEYCEKSFKKVDRETFDYVLKRERYRINLGELSCTCHQFMDRATCSHLIYLSHLMELDLGYYNPITKFVFLKKRGRPKNASKALSRD